MTSNYRNTLLSDNWVAIVTQQIQANPYGIAFTIEPFVLGQYDAAHGKPRSPQQYFKASDMADYEAGYQAATQAWAAQVQAVNDALPVVDYEAELEDLQSGMEDVEFFRTGGNW